MTQLVDTLIIVNHLPGIYSERHSWHMPDPVAMRALYALIGSGSQVFAFHQMDFGDPRNVEHDDVWRDQFTAMWNEAFGAEVSPEVLVESGFSRTFYGGPPTSRRTVDDLYGRQTSSTGATATPIRLYCPDYWRSSMSDTRMLRQRCLALIDHFVVASDVLHLNTSPSHFDDRLRVWASRSGMTSEVYSSIVKLETWDGKRWLVGRAVPLTRTDQ